MTKADVIGIDVCDMKHIDDVINDYCVSNSRELVSVQFYEVEGMKYMLLITRANNESL